MDSLRPPIFITEFSIEYLRLASAVTDIFLEGLFSPLLHKSFEGKLTGNEHLR